MCRVLGAALKHCLLILTLIVKCNWSLLRGCVSISNQSNCSLPLWWVQAPPLPHPHSAPGLTFVWLGTRLSPVPRHYLPPRSHGPALWFWFAICCPIRHSHQVRDSEGFVGCPGIMSCPSAVVHLVSEIFCCNVLWPFPLSEVVGEALSKGKLSCFIPPQGVSCFLSTIHLKAIIFLIL